MRQKMCTKCYHCKLTLDVTEVDRRWWVERRILCCPSGPGPVTGRDRCADNNIRQAGSGRMDSAAENSKREHIFIASRGNCSSCGPCGAVAAITNICKQ